MLAGGVPAYAEPGEGGTKKLQDALELTAKGHIEAKAKLDNSKRRQTALTGELKAVEVRLVGLTAQVGEVAAQSYRAGRLTPTAMLLNTATPQAFLQRAADLDLMAQRTASGCAISSRPGSRPRRPRSPSTPRSVSSRSSSP